MFGQDWLSLRGMEIWSKTDDCFELLDFFSRLGFGRDRPQRSRVEEPLDYFGLWGGILG
jgi:hypothetical protein